MKEPAANTFVKTLFFGNYFYGICAVALAIEASLQQHFPLNDPLFYLMLFCATVLYYSRAYLQSEVSAKTDNIRSVWYARNHSLIGKSQILLLLIFIACGMIFLFRHWHPVVGMRALEWLLIFVFPFIAVLYYSEQGSFLARYNLRNVGWLKPFVIGFTWAGMVTLYPVMYYHILQGTHYDFSMVGTFLFVKNFMYITLLCIIFDIKDYEMDYNIRLKTFVVKLGLRKTIFFVIIPLCVAGLAAFVGYAFLNHFHPARILLNTIPFLLVIVVAFSMRDRRSIFYYLIIIDGLMLVKALCGITAMIFFGGHDAL